VSLWLRRLARRVGIHTREPSYWEQFASRPLRTDASAEDLLRWAILGELDRVRSRLAARADELRTSVGMGGHPNIHLHAQALAIDWLVRGVFDHAAAIALAVDNPPLDEDSAWREVDWFNLLRPTAETASRFAGFGKLVRREKKRGARGDGDALEVIERDAAMLGLVSTVRCADTLCAPDVGSAAFERYLEATLDFYHVVDAIFAITLRAALFAPSTPPQAALRWLRVT
jgi:hypothetical protein